MSDKLNHHFVPQYHFRLFTGGRRFVHLAMRDGSRFISGASIRGQCARHKLYRKEVEDWLGSFEARHAQACRTVIDIARSQRQTALSEEEKDCICEALLLQLNRTPQRARLYAASYEQMVLHTYHEHLKTLSPTPERRALMESIQSGKVTFRDSLSTSLTIALIMASRSVGAIADLRLLILRNHTTIPFIMGDSPCVLSNHYMRGVRERGVLGLVTPGLMAILPLNPRTEIMLYDSSVYTLKHSTSAGCVDLVDVGDVSVCNALQVHAAEECIYFAELGAEDHVRRLVSAHRPLMRQRQIELVVHAPGTMLVDGVPNRGDIVHTFEPQLPITLNPSFIATTPFVEEGPPRARNPESARVVEQQLGTTNRPSRIGIEQLVRWVESEMVVPDGI